MRSRRGMTLIELLVVLAIVGVAAAVATSAGIARSRVSDAFDSAIDVARTRAIRSGRSVTATVPTAAGVTLLTVSPDGAAVADSGSPIDRLTGRPVRSRAGRSVVNTEIGR